MTVIERSKKIKALKPAADLSNFLVSSELTLLISKPRDLNIFLSSASSLLDDSIFIDSALSDSIPAELFNFLSSESSLLDKFFFNESTLLDSKPSDLLNFVSSVSAFFDNFTKDSCVA